MMTRRDDLIYKLNREGLELERKRDKLNDFIRNNPEFKDFTDEMKDITKMQLYAMNIYVIALKYRLELIENDIFGYTEWKRG